MICAILLAAGRSQRMGAQKLLLPFGGRTVVGHIARQIARSPVDETLAVVSEDAPGIGEALGDRAVTLVTNPDPEGDMLSSVRCGLRALPPDCDAVLVALGDQPSLTSELIGRMLRAFRAAGCGIVVPVHEGRRGHPLLFSTRYRREILTGYDQVGLRGLLGAHPEDLFELRVTSPSVLADMDTPEDYRREIGKLPASRPTPRDPPKAP